MSIRRFAILTILFPLVALFPPDLNPWKSVIQMNNAPGRLDFGVYALRWSHLTFRPTSFLTVAREYIGGRVEGDVQLMDFQPREPDSPPYTLYMAVNDVEERDTLSLVGTFGCYGEWPIGSSISITGTVSGLDLSQDALRLNLSSVERHPCP